MEVHLSGGVLRTRVNWEYIFAQKSVLVKNKSYTIMLLKRNLCTTIMKDRYKVVKQSCKRCVKIFGYK